MHFLHHTLALLLFAFFSFVASNFYADGTEKTGADEPGGPELNIVIPGDDTTRVTQSRQRIAANTDPENRAYIDDKEVTVYKSGAFVGLVDIPSGESSTKIKVVDKNGESRTKERHFIRPKPPETTPETPLRIDDTMMQPSRILALGDDETIEMQFKGSEGQRAYFSIDGLVEQVEMKEQHPSRTGGLKGVYRGSYTTGPDDRVRDQEITFILENDQGDQVTATAPALITITPDDFPRIAEVTARRAYLNSGSGTDRLGGARLGYLEKGVRLEVMAREGHLYRVRLSDQMEAYIPMRFAEILPENTPLPRSLTGSATVSGNDRADMVTFSLGQRLPYIANMRTDPNMIEVDIFGADSNTNWITHHKTARGIESVNWEQIGTNHFRLQIHLKHDTHWGYHIGYGVGSSLRIQVQRPPKIASKESPLEGVHIALDAGHGGGNRGALGATGLEEKEVVMDITRKLKNLLEEEGAQVFMTRERDVHVPMIQRSEMLIASDADVLVSIHANSIGGATNPEAIKGTSSYYRYHAFQPLASMVHDRMLELPLRDFGLIGSFNFSLNALTEMPNVLVETAFMSNPEDEMMLMDPEYQQKMVESITDGLRDYFRRYGLEASSVPESHARLEVM